MNNYYVLTGTPGTGKTTLITQLRANGLRCADEPARAVLREQLATDGPALPSKNPELFIKAMLDRQIRNFTELRSGQDPVFFDRGIPDLIAYAIRFGVDPSNFEIEAASYRYNQMVFIFPPWKAIFVNDELRKISFEKSLEFHESLVEAYERLGYQLIEVPMVSVEMRLDFIVTLVNEGLG